MIFIFLKWWRQKLFSSTKLLPILSGVKIGQKLPEPIQKCLALSEMYFPPKCPVFLSVFYLLLKAIRTAEWIFPVTLQEAAAACVGSLKTLVRVVSPSSCKVYLVGLLVMRLFQTHSLHSQHVHEHFKEKEMYRFSSFKKTKPNPVKPMLALRQHFLCRFPLWDRSSYDRYSLESWASLLLLHTFIKHWCCVLVLYWCTGTLTGARVNTE